MRASTILSSFALPLLFALPLAAQAQDRDLQRRITPVVQVVREARPAVVFIQSNVPGERRDIFGRARKVQSVTSGSGVVIFEDGYIVTNNHVVKGATEIRVSFDEADDPTVYSAKLISQDRANDLALIKIDGDQPFVALPLGSNDPMLGETVVAIGNPYGQTHTVSSGIISGLHRDVQASGLAFSNLIQTDAAINPGNSGGPLLNINGELIGINTALNMGAENIGFAIPVDQVRRVLNEHLLSLDQARAWLGFDVDPQNDFTLHNVTPGGPAQLAGLREGDRLEVIASHEVGDEGSYRLTRLGVQPLDRVPLRVQRGRDQLEVVLTAWNRLDGYLYERMGVRVEPALMSQGMRRYLRVTEIQPEGPSALLGISVGDILEAVQPAGSNLKRVTSRDELAWLLSALDEEAELTVYIWHDDDGDGSFRLHGDNKERYRGPLTLR
jgi:serine protease Do